jgi:hypothetical protein
VKFKQTIHAEILWADATVLNQTFGSIFLLLKGSSLKTDQFRNEICRLFGEFL